MTTATKLSVIMTIYNGEAFIVETVDAVLAQTFADFEYVIVDNGCTDGTMDIIRAYDDPRIRVVTAPHHGTFGEGIRLAYKNARGGFIAVQDGDDVPAPDRFARQVAALDGDPKSGLVSAAFEKIDSDGNTLGESHPPTDAAALVDAIQTGNPLAHSTYMYRKAASDAVGGYPAEYAFGPDFALVIRLLAAGWGVIVINEVLLKLRIHGGQTSQAPAMAATRAHDALHLLIEASSLPDVSPPARQAGSRSITKTRIRYALALIGSGRMVDGLGNLAPTLARHPLYGGAVLAQGLGRRIGLIKPAKF